MWLKKHVTNDNRKNLKQELWWVRKNIFKGKQLYSTCRPMKGECTQELFTNFEFPRKGPLSLVNTRLDHLGNINLYTKTYEITSWNSFWVSIRRKWLLSECTRIQKWWPDPGPWKAPDAQLDWDKLVLGVSPIHLVISNSLFNFVQ